MAARFIDPSTAESHLIQLINGRVAWASLEKAFRAECVKLYEEGAEEPVVVAVAPCGLTFMSFDASSTREVLVNRHSLGDSLHMIGSKSSEL